MPNEGDIEEDSLDFIERCIVCRVYESDWHAALVVAMSTGRELRWARMSGDKEYKPYLVA